MNEQLETTLTNIRTALDREDIVLAQKLLNKLHPADQADAISDRPLQEQTDMLPTLSVDNAADVLEHLDEDEAAEAKAVHGDAGEGTVARTARQLDRVVVVLEAVDGAGVVDHRTQGVHVF